jgi:hypothetical protein
MEEIYDFVILNDDPFRIEFRFQVAHNALIRKCDRLQFAPNLVLSGEVVENNL